MALMAWAASMVCACHRSEPAAQKADQPAVETPQPKASVELSAEQIEKIGITVTPAKSISYTPENIGFGVVMSHDAIAQAVAEIATAQATVNQSRAALARVKRLSGTPGAFGTEAQETAERQSLVDAAALSLAQRKLSVILGATTLWQDRSADKILAELASGRTKLVRVTFPLGALKGPAPPSLRVARLDPDSATESWITHKVWDAPADASVPGRSFFSLLESSNVSEGERLQAWAASGATISGVLIPQSAAILSDGKYWCYVETQTGKFERQPIDIGRPVDGGYFVSDGIAVNDAIVTSSAGLLLARETNSSADAG